MTGVLGATAVAIVAAVILGAGVGGLAHVASWELRSRWPRAMFLLGALAILAWLGSFFLIRALPGDGMLSFIFGILWIVAGVTALVIGAVYAVAWRPAVPWYESLAAGFVEAPVLLGTIEAVARLDVWNNLNPFIAAMGLTFLGLTLVRAFVLREAPAGSAGGDRSRELP